MMLQKRLCTALIFGFVLPQAQAGGLWLNEYGTPAMGKARAGSIADVFDASAAFHNPAAMSRLESRQWMLAPMVIASTAEFDIGATEFPNTGGDGGDAGSIAPAATLAYVHPLNDRWTFGFATGGITGAALDYESDWVGRVQVLDVELIGLTLMPSVSYKVSENFSVGFALPLLYTELEMTIAVPSLPLTDPLGPEGKVTIDGSDLLVGYNLSAHWRVSQKTQIGLVLQSEFEAKYGGDVKIEPLGFEAGVDTEILLSRTARLGLSHQLTEKLAVSATLGWDDWSQLKNVNISGDSQGIVKPRNWEDTYHYALGLDYRLSNDLSLSAGLAYDTNPVSSQDRTADMPVDRQVRYAFGIKKKVRADLEVGVHMVYADLGDAAIDAQFFSGDYGKNNVLFLGLSFNWLLD